MFIRALTRRAVHAAAAFSLVAIAGIARAQVPYGFSQSGQSVSSAQVQPNSTFTSTVQRVMPNGTIMLGNGLTVTLGGMSPFGGGSWGSGGNDFSGNLSPMLVGQSVRVTTLPIGRDGSSSNGPVPVLMYYGSGYDSLVNQAMVQRGFARYQSEYFQAAPDVREAMRQAEIDAKNRGSGLWMGPGTGTGSAPGFGAAATPFGGGSPDQQRKAIAEHNKRVEEAQRKAAAEEAKAAASKPAEAPPVPEPPALAPEAPAP